MEYPLLPTFTLLNLALVATHAALHPVHVVYWKSVLPTTPMPKAITGILYGRDLTSYF
ncbi:hypothetical protein GLYMA_06G081050v4 [Glycine max]|nr:hypothetical protein GLYMA_06G081050v4 [Glycine max]KAH1124740.1 hypothetical protein GYH30_014433 [Glycine max]